VDPEIPVLTLEDLGVLRGVERSEGRIVVKLTPTYTGCPATLAIQLAVEAALAEAGFSDARVETVLSPPWSTDDITEEGRRKLTEFGIAPPGRGAGARGLFAQETVACPKCGSTATARISEFGSTACKALWRCEACSEPFDYFKCL
jgi:ring-1,2-phenylacetyl-CoA epoxidase subunit PaaD